jgi:hypothetical protein
MTDISNGQKDFAQDFVSKEALDIFNKLFGTNFSCDFEGYLNVKLPGYTVNIFSSGEVIGIMSDDLTDCVYYPYEFLNEAKKKISSITEKST